MLDKDLIQDPTTWRLAMRLDPDTLHVMAFSPRENDSLIYRALPLDMTNLSQLKALEDVVYDNPMLLCDFAQVSCLIATPRFIITPPDGTAEDDCIALMRKMFPTDRHSDLKADGMEGMYMQAEEEIVRFLRRTFACIRLSHPLVPLIKYFSRATMAGAGNGRNMYVSFLPDRIDVVATNRGQLLMANTFKFTAPLDIVYYIMSCRHQLGFNAESDPLLITGDVAAREEAVATLKKYIRNVMPVIFPSAMFKYGKDAMTAPFDLIALNLCE